MGYEFAAAFADLVDNSIEARANTVRIDVVWDGEDSYVHIADNGGGMNAAELREALRFGSDRDYDTEDLGKVRLEVESRNDKPVFVGIARTSDVDNYLAGVSHTTVTDVDTSPFDADYDDHAGDRRPVAPADSHIWAASEQGSGKQTLHWEIEDGDYSVVVMNADGSLGVDADVRRDPVPL